MRHDCAGCCKTGSEAAGWVVGDTDQFLGLTDAESEFIHMKLGLARELKERPCAPKYLKWVHLIRSSLL